MSTLLAIGDSHTFGAEIYGEGDNRPESIYKAYPEKLRQLLEIDECINLGQPGASIMRTERLLVEYIAGNPKPDLVILGWTCLGRFTHLLIRFRHEPQENTVESHRYINQA